MSNETLHGQQLFIFAARVNRAAFIAEHRKLARLERIKAAAKKRKGRSC